MNEPARLLAWPDAADTALDRIRAARAGWQDQAAHREGGRRADMGTALSAAWHNDTRGARDQLEPGESWGGTRRRAQGSTMSKRTCHALLAIAFVAIMIGLARVGWYVVMAL